MYKTQKKNNVILQKFMNHCATMIQANFKGYKQRKNYIKFIPVYRRLKELLYAGFVGWKTRKVMKLSNVKSKITEIALLKTQQKSMQLRIAKRNFSDQVIRLLKNGMWTYYLLKQKKVPLSQRNFSFDNKRQVESSNKTNLKQVLKIIPKPSQKKQSSQKQSNQVQLTKDQQLSNEKQKQRQMQKVIEPKNKTNERRAKKFEIPSNQNQKVEKKKQVKLQIQTSQPSEQLQLIKPNNCQTPNYSSNQTQQFSFHTKPRHQSQSGNRQKNSFSEVQETFKQIQVLNYTSRKGLNMTLSKKFADPNQNQIRHINENVLRDFSKIKIVQKQTATSSQMDSYNQVRETLVFDQALKLQKTQLNRNQLNKPSQNKRDLNIQMRKEDFEKKKIEFQNRSKKFKNIITS